MFPSSKCIPVWHNEILNLLEYALHMQYFIMFTFPSMSFSDQWLFLVLSGSSCSEVSYKYTITSLKLIDFYSPYLDGHAGHSCEL